MSEFDNINGIYAKDTELRNGISDLRGDILSQTIKPINITENGTYTSDPTAGAYGYSPVTVNVPSTIDYSTTEQDTGRKWIDGKPIYQKTFVPTAPATSWEGTNNTIDVSGLNIDNLINTEAQGQNRNNGNYFSLTMVSDQANTIVLDSTKSNMLVYLGNPNAPARVFDFTIQYTKTTDTGN